MTVAIHIGDCLEVMRKLADSSVDAVVTDPPYHLKNPGGGPHGKGTNTPYARARARAGADSKGFMGKKWDGGDIAFRPETWAEVLRVAKPGAFLLAFGGTRTYHRMVVAIEDAGWEIRDCVMWLYGSGFPKSHNGEWGGTALKPGYEPVVMARKPLIGTVAANFETFGTGGLKIDECRVGWPDGVVPEIGTPGWGGPSKTLSAVPGVTGAIADRAPPSNLGRWPANVITDGSDEVVGSFPDAPGQQARARTDGAPQGNRVLGDLRHVTLNPEVRGDAGSAARFFYCAKASRADRNAGLEAAREPATNHDATMREREDADWAARNGNPHPTVKPTDLMRYLTRLVTPRGGVILDPFMGSGSTGRGALLEEFHFVGIEMDPEYAAVATARIAQAERSRDEEAIERAAAESQFSLFAKEAIA
jgi:site-specific DNA-methyltransferase (adenine-specific)